MTYAASLTSGVTTASSNAGVSHAAAMAMVPIGKFRAPLHASKRRSRHSHHHHRHKCRYRNNRNDASHTLPPFQSVPYDRVAG
jgi:hypothetical protein